MRRTEKPGGVVSSAGRLSKTSVHGVKWKAADTLSVVLRESGMESLWAMFPRLLEMRGRD
ncbi:hypothetical protein NE683_10375 [Bariatricus massiliensis]|uniref:Uncharacterized protein n=1 Tax=Bariatricus massiliensis TaxID=1745713 RepID=A0ABS8DG03_9FIRM|nr:hypothetical protein [Bariatricus massiliensis]MCB7304232.1 hypothetical protein [Bariatricus massiliensis]MCB7374883.1 hypothetical protein [Bariatricus massiliensis]MCB7387342.1 hypothetical protein [Bariatricus massiliensis]MCB7411504.1 hypothetical protein [Bariatricus massiliensis]MCQ5253639.1 hypothetical protein [Bariatricus massiliensis]